MAATSVTNATIGATISTHSIREFGHQDIVAG